MLMKILSRNLRALIQSRLSALLLGGKILPQHLQDLGVDEVEEPEERVRIVEKRALDCIVGYLETSIAEAETSNLAKTAALAALAKLLCRRMRSASSAEDRVALAEKIDTIVRSNKLSCEDVSSRLFGIFGTFRRFGIAAALFGESRRSA